MMIAFTDECNNVSRGKIHEDILISTQVRLSHQEKGFISCNCISMSKIGSLLLSIWSRQTLLNPSTETMEQWKVKGRKKEGKPKPTSLSESNKIIKSTNALKNNKALLDTKSFQKYFLLPYLFNLYNNPDVQILFLFSFYRRITKNSYLYGNFPVSKVISQI